MKHQTMPGVHYATLTNEETGEVIPLYLHSRGEIDAEIEQRIRSEPHRRPAHEATRAKWRTMLAPAETHVAPG